MTRLSSLRRRMLHCAAALAFLGALPLPAGAAAPLAAPASAMLTYKLKASAKGFMINVDSQLDWKREGDTYHLTNRGSFMVFSFMFESTGRVDAQGVQPARYQETRNRRVKSVDFDPKGGVRYSGGAQEPFQAGIQDRMSVLMQLAALGRGNPGAFAAGKVAHLPRGRIEPERQLAFQGRRQRRARYRHGQDQGGAPRARTRPRRWAEDRGLAVRRA